MSDNDSDWQQPSDNEDSDEEDIISSSDDVSDAVVSPVVKTSKKRDDDSSVTLGSSDTESDDVLPPRKKKRVNYSDELISEISDVEDSEFSKLSSQEKEKVNSENKLVTEFLSGKIPPRYHILLSSLPLSAKAAAVAKLESLGNIRDDSSEYHKLNNWISGLLKIKFGTYSNLPIKAEHPNYKIKEFLNQAYQTLDSVVYGMDNAKVEIVQYIAQAISNPSACGNVLGLEGPPGTGKTTLIRKGLAKVLQKPCVCVALGGASDSSFLDGHGFTYEGSECGRIITGLQEAQTMDPIYFFDEVDKISKTSKGQEITGVLIHLIDPSQNYEFQDKYYSEIEIDLSRATFVFCFNDADKIDPILRDRMKIIKIPGYNLPQKKVISEKYLIPKICEQVGIDKNNIQWTSDALDNLILLSMEEDGVRTLEQDFKTIIMKINTLRFTDNMPYQIPNFELPFTVTPEALNILQKGPGRKNSLSVLNNYQHLTINQEKELVEKVNLIPIEPKHRVLLSKMPTAAKAMVIRKLDSIDKSDLNDTEKQKQWVENVLRIPFGVYHHIQYTVKSPREEIKSYLTWVKEQMDAAVYGLEEAKKELLQWIVQRITNQNAPGIIFALSGPPGTGKTTLIKEGFAKALNRPFGFIPLGGAKDSSFLKGHSYTYVGSQPGKIVEILQETKTMDPVIVLDELDKVAPDASGAEIIGSLMHVIDSSQNKSFQDRYLGQIDIDLSKVTFIFSFNQEEAIDPTLMDRIKVLKVSKYSLADKLQICKKYLIPKIIKEMGLKTDEIIWEKGTIEELIKINKEDGVRKLEQSIRSIFSKINTSKYIEVEEFAKVSFPFKITKDLIMKLVRHKFSSMTKPPFNLYV